MNLNFCRHHCGKGSNPRCILRNSEGRWYLSMNDSSTRFGDTCNFVEIEDASEFLENPPPGWDRVRGSDEIGMYEGNAEDFMWRIHLKEGQSSCPFLAEHLMYDLHHERKVSEWRQREEKRLALIEERKRRGECRG